MSYDNTNHLSEQAIKRLRVGAPEDLTCDEMDALLDYIDALKGAVAHWSGRYDELLSAVGGVWPS